MASCELNIVEILEKLKITPSESIESETIEFKSYQDEKALHNSKELAEELSAFANHQGGTIIVGIKDSSNVDHGKWHQQLHGLPPVDLTELKQRIKGRLKPNININIGSYKYENKNYVAIEVKKSYETLVSTSGGKVCVRDGRSSRPMSPREIEQAVKSLAPFDWSADVLSVEIEDAIDEKALSQAVNAYCIQKKYKEKISSAKYLEAIGATSNGRLSKGGLLFLGKTSAIKEHFDVLEYRFTWKKKNGDLVINEIWNGNIWNAVIRSKRNFRDCNTIQKFRSGETEFDAPLMDDIAFHEAFLNALVHRDYSAEGIVSVVYTDEQLKIRSPGGFYGEITSDNIAYHEPCHRNKNLARILMAHNLVDRAGMGVLRMGLGSLRYGRAFPEFREHSGAIEVIMEAEYLRPGIAVLWIENRDWGVPELLALNSVYEKGFVTVDDLEAKLRKVNPEPWKAIRKAAESVPQIELCGSSEGIFVRVKQEWKKLLSVDRTFRVSQSSEKHVNLFNYLRTHKYASNSDLTETLGFNHSSQTSRFLRDAKYVEREGSGRGASWRIVDPRSI